MSKVLYDIGGGVAHLRLNRPDVANAVDLDTSRELDRLVRRVETDAAVRAVLVSGSGSRFCAGGDVGWMLEASDRAAALTELATSLDSTLLRLGSLGKPVVAAVHGAVAGAGLAVMLSCDLVVASSSTRFVFAYPAVGLTPDTGASWLLPRAIGQQRALELALTGRSLDAETARSWGLVTEVVEADPLDRARELATQLAAGPSWALGQARRLIRAHQAVSREAAGLEETRTIAAAVRTPEAEAALARFVRQA